MRIAGDLQERRQNSRKKTPTNSPLKGENSKSPFKGDLEGLLPNFDVGRFVFILCDG